MAVRTKQPQEINSQLGINETVYFEIDPLYWGATVINTENGDTPVYQFTMYEYTIDSNGNRKPIITIPIYYKTATYDSMFGSFGSIELKDSFDDLIISEIDRVNQIPFSPNRVQNIRYWNLTASDLEKVV
jgi:hypothetical protein